jgi:hypothetical protein
MTNWHAFLCAVVLSPGTSGAFASAHAQAQRECSGTLTSFDQLKATEPVIYVIPIWTKSNPEKTPLGLKTVELEHNAMLTGFNRRSIDSSSNRKKIRNLSPLNYQRCYLVQFFILVFHQQTPSYLDDHI